MSGRFLLETNIVIAIFAEDSGVMDHLAQAAEVFVPSICWVNSFMVLASRTRLMRTSPGSKNSQPIPLSSPVTL